MADQDISVEDTSPFDQTEFSENLHEEHEGLFEDEKYEELFEDEKYEELFEDEKYDEMFEDVSDSGFLIEDDEFIEHDAISTLLWDGNLAVEDRAYFSDLDWEQDRLLNFTSDAYRNTISTNREQDSCDVSVEPLPDHGPLFSDDYFCNQVLDVGHQWRQDDSDHCVLDDSCVDEAARVEFADAHGSHDEMIMEN
jgi:hypothetical protein